jgi:hypothetical protein
MEGSANTTPYHDKLSTEAFLYGKSRFADQTDILSYDTNIGAGFKEGASSSRGGPHGI